MAGPEVEDIRIPEDLDAIDLHNRINEGLVEQRAAGTHRILESLEVARELTAQIEGAAISNEEVVTLVLDSRKHEILTRSRRLGGMAAPLAIQP